MATLTIRNIDEDLKSSLRVRAALNGQSMEEEVRVILRAALQQPLPSKGLGQRLVQRFKKVGDDDLALPRRRKPRAAPDWRERP